MNEIKKLLTIFSVFVLSFGIQAQGTDTPVEVSRQESITVMAKLFSELDNLHVVNRRALKNNAYGAYPEYRGKALSYVVADLLVEKIEIGHTEVSRRDTIVTRYSIHNFCEKTVAENGTEKYTCTLSRFSHIMRFDDEGKEVPAWGEDHEGYGEMLRYTAEKEGDSISIGEEAEFLFAG